MTSHPEPQSPDEPLAAAAADVITNAHDTAEQVAVSGWTGIEPADGLRELLREAIETVHQTGSIRDHADPNDKTGWNVHGIETCEDPLCVDALAALAARPEPELREAAEAAYDVLTRLNSQAADGGGQRGEVYVTVQTWRDVVSPVIERLGAALRSTKPG